MKNFPLIIVLALSVSFVACQKQQTEEERRAEVDRQVQERLAAERQQQQAQQLAQREASVSAREQALAAQQQQATSTPEATIAPESVAREPATEGEAPSSYSMFYTRLEPYGDWIETDDYGYVYRPREAENVRWRPYTNGRWVYTDAGWTWISEEPFGWAAYHYGRWTRLRGLGWIWVPGSEWAPAWVSWRKGGQYVGWAPLPPEAQFDRASGIRSWSDSYYDVGPDQYVFVPATEIGEERVERAIIPEQQNVTIVNETTNVTNITYNNNVIVNQGPSYDELRAHSRVPIQRLRLQRETVAPGAGARTLVRGEVVTIPAPVIVAAPAPERPRAVKQTVKQAVVDRGWSAVTNEREAEQARAKMKSEATPPPNAPPKKFVRPAAASAASTAAKPTVAATSVPVRASVAPAASTATARPVQTAATTPARSAAPERTPLPANMPRPSATMRPHLSPLPAMTPVTTMPQVFATPVTPPPPSATIRPRLAPLRANTPVTTLPPASATPPPAHSPRAVVPPNVRRAPPPRVSPSVAFSASPAAGESGPSSPPPAATSPIRDERPRGEKKRQLPPRERPTSPSPSPTPQ